MIKPTIVHVLDSAGIFGMEQVVINLARHQQDNFNIVVINTSNNLDMITKLSAMKGVKAINPFLTLGFCFKDIRKLCAVIASYNPDLIHLHSYKASIYVAPKFWRKVPIVRTVHGFCATKIFSKIYLNELADKMFFNFHDKLVWVSKYQNAGCQCKTVISNGIPIYVPLVGKLNEGIVKFCDKKDINTKVLCAVGRLSPEKNHRMLISAIGHDNLDGTVKLVIIGNGPLESALKQHAQDEGVAHLVYFAGFHENAAEYLSAMNLDSTTPLIDGLIQPSLREGASITILEALRAKTPILASDVGDMSDLITRGIINNANITSAEHLAGSIEMFCLNLANHQLEAQVKMGYKIFKDEFSSEVMSQKYVDLYDNLLTTERLPNARLAS